MKEIKTQKQLDALIKEGVREGEEVDIVGIGLRLTAKLEVFGFLRVSTLVDMNYSRHVVAWDSSHVVASESSRVEAWGSSRVEAWGSSHVVAWDSSHVVARDSSHVEAWDSSHVEARGSVGLHCYSLKANITLWGYACVHKMVAGKADITKKQKTATIIEVPKFVGSWQNYIANYPVVEKGKKVLMYKTVHKADNGTFFADYDKSFIYKVGQTYTEENSKENRSCAKGLHISHKSWALRFGSNWDDMALIECEVDPKDIVVSDDCDGKVRTSKLTVIREVPKSEYYD